MHFHCGNNNRAPRWTFTDPCKSEVRSGAREESASPAWLAAPAMNARDTTKVYKWRFDTGCGPTLYRKYHSHNAAGKRHNITWVEPLEGNCTTSSTRQREQVWQKCKKHLYNRTDALSLWHQQKSTTVNIQRKVNEKKTFEDTCFILYTWLTFLKCSEEILDILKIQLLKLCKGFNPQITVFYMTNRNIVVTDFERNTQYS